MGNVMRRVLAALAFAGAIAGGSPVAAPAETTQTATVSVAVPHVPVSPPRGRDEAAMVLVGTALIALAAAVRRAA